ncbi:MAG: hypothetical protein ACRC7H_08855, partial [Plesiomonas shigelloides]
RTFFDNSFLCENYRISQAIFTGFFCKIAGIFSVNFIDNFTVFLRIFYGRFLITGSLCENNRISPLISPACKISGEIL